MPTVKEQPMKSLRWYAGTLSDKSRGVAITKQVEEGKYSPKPPRHGLDKIEFVPQGGNVSDRRKANEAMENQSGVKCEVAADLKGCERFFPIPTTK